MAIDLLRGIDTRNPSDVDNWSPSVIIRSDQCEWSQVIIASWGSVMACIKGIVIACMGTIVIACMEILLWYTASCHDLTQIRLSLCHFTLTSRRRMPQA